MPYQLAFVFKEGCCTLISGRVGGGGSEIIARTGLGISATFLFFVFRGAGTSSKGLEDDPLLGV